MRAFCGNENCDGDLSIVQGGHMHPGSTTFDGKEECEHGCNAENCGNCELEDKPKEEWEVVFDKMCSKDPSLGSSGWHVAPSTVKIFIKGLLHERNLVAEREELLDKHIKKLEDWFNSLRAILDK